MNVFITITVTHTDKCNQPLHIMHTEKYSFTHLVVKDLGEDAHCFLWIIYLYTSVLGRLSFRKIASVHII